jgi:HEAT repeat protein
VALFSGVVHQLEDLLIYLLKKKDFDFAGQIIEAFHRPVEPAFRPRMMEALKKTAPRNIIVLAIEDLRKQPKESAAYQSAYAYVSTLSAQAVDIILELLATEEDKTKRIFLLELVKDIGRDQIALLGERLSDGRWYFVRNIVTLLGESKSDQAIAMLRKAADHEHIRIREEVIRSLVSIGGKKAAAVMAKFLRDKDDAIQMAAIRAFSELPGLVAEETTPLLTFLEDRPITRKDHELTLQAIRSLGMVGGRDAAVFLKRYEQRRWWKSRKLQRELKDAALLAMAGITERGKHGGREKG